MNTVQDHITHLKFITGQDNLSNEDAVRLLNFGIDDYSHLSLTSSGRWKHDMTSGSQPRDTATLQAGDAWVVLDEKHLFVERVEATYDGETYVLTPLDVRDSQEALTTIYETNGKPLYYDKEGEKLYPYPRPDREMTVTLFYSRPVAYVSVDNLSAEIDVPRIHNEYIVLAAADKMSFRLSDPNAARISTALAKKENEVREFYSKRDQNTSRQLVGKVKVLE